MNSDHGSETGQRVRVDKVSLPLNSLVESQEIIKRIAAIRSLISMISKISHALATHPVESNLISILSSSTDIRIEKYFTIWTNIYITFLKIPYVCGLSA